MARRPQNRRLAKKLRSLPVGGLLHGVRRATISTCFSVTGANFAVLFMKVMEATGCYPGSIGGATWFRPGPGMRSCESRFSGGLVKHLENNLIANDNFALAA